MAFNPDDADLLTRRALFDTRHSSLAGLSVLHDVVGLLRADPANHLHRGLGDAVTETSFFRDQTLFEALQTSILPTLIPLRAPTQRLRIWSAAGSTGQEAFSLAILLAELIPDLLPWDITIHATDISRHAIDYARRGRFRANEVHQGLTPRHLAQYFTREADEYLVQPLLARLCLFHQVNLCTPWPAMPRFDLILLRNVLLYLSPADRTAVLSQMHRQLTPDGYLILGNAEQAEDSTTLFVPHSIQDTYVYRPIILPG